MYEVDFEMGTKLKSHQIMLEIIGSDKFSAWLELGKLTAEVYWTPMMRFCNDYAQPLLKTNRIILTLEYNYITWTIDSDNFAYSCKTLECSHDGYLEITELNLSIDFKNKTMEHL